MWYKWGYFFSNCPANKSSLDILMRTLKQMTTISRVLVSLAGYHVCLRVPACMRASACVCVCEREAGSQLTIGFQFYSRLTIVEL